MFDKIDILPLGSNNIFWKISCREDQIATHLTKGQWEAIMGKGFSENHFFHFLDNYPYYIRSYTLKDINGQPLAFIYILIDPNYKNVVSVHGGGWSNPKIHYQGYTIFLEALLSSGLKVRTSCNITNKVAIRFSKSVGFVPYRYTETNVYMWINEKRLKGSAIFQRFKER